MEEDRSISLPKVLLIFPPKGFSSKEPLPALGLIYLAAMLEKDGIPVKILDAAVEHLSWRSLRKRIKEESPDIVGITSLTEFRYEAFKTARIAREVLGKDIPVTIGGPHVSLTAADTMRFQPDIDVVVRGEAEYTFLELCYALWEDRDLSGIMGISYRKNGEIIHNPPADLPADLDALPFPARYLMDMKRYNFRLDVPGKGRVPAAHIITSRGCPFHCSFCATSKLSGRRWRNRSPENVLAELEDILKKQPEVKAVWFYDDTFTMNKRRVEEICDGIIERNLDIAFTCSIRVDTVNYDLLKKMREAGCFKVFFGVESGSPRILDEICQKQITLEQVETVSKWLDDLGIEKNPGYIISFPEETLEDAEQTLNFMKKVGGIASMSLLRIYPGTRIEEVARERGMLPPDFSWSRLDQPLPNQFSAAHGSSPIFIDRLSWEELSDLTLQWAQYQGISPWKKLPGVLKNIRSWQDARHVWTMGWRYLKKKVSP